MTTLLCQLRSALYWMERQHTPVPRFVFVCVLLLALVFAGLTYDALVSFAPR